MQFYQELISRIKKEHPTKEKIQNIKLQLCKKYKVKIPTEAEIFLNSSNKDFNILKKCLIRKPVRTLSGVAVCAIMTKPIKCPHGKCLMCPGGPNSYFGNMPQSYTGKEPATRRAIRNNFDPYLQVFNRLEHYIVNGHCPEKIELIIMGGTFPSFNKKYQEQFVMYSFKALNDFSKLFFKNKQFNIKKFKEFFELPHDINDISRIKKIHKKLLKLKSKSSLEKEQLKNENSNIKCIGLTIETRPDYANLEHGNQMLKLGCTRVEIGIQSVYDDVLKFIKRGHSTKDNINAIRTLKDLGFKINLHYMLGLTNDVRDLNGLKELFYDENYRPDMLKLYPCMVIKGTKLYDLWKNNKYKAITTEQAANLILEFKKIVPKYTRIMRIQRDIPTYLTEAGVDKTNLRQYIHSLMKQKNIKCNCIRCSEIKNNKIKGKVNLKVIEYNASKGKEFFIYLENNDKLIGFLRLRKPSQFLRKELKDSFIVRELHIYGTSTSLLQKGQIQHKGYGKILLKKAEQITKKQTKKLVIISGVGVRNYYKKLGYKLQGPYMVKGF
jgi:elongator complex protein 3